MSDRLAEAKEAMARVPLWYRHIAVGLTILLGGVCFVFGFVLGWLA